MGEKRNATMLESSGTHEAAKDLNQNPEADDKDRRNAHYLPEKAKEKKGVDPCMREQQDIGAQHPRYCTARANHG